MDASSPFLVFSQDHPDFNESDEASAIDRQIRLTKVVDQWLRGEESVETVLDAVEELDADGADQFVEDACAQIEHIVHWGITFDSDDSGLLLPAHLKGRYG